MAENYNLADQFKIADLETLKIISHPQRIEILTTLRDPKTVKEIAEEIDADPTKLYYHIRLMEKAKLIQVVETNLVSGIVEKKYLVVAKAYVVDDGIFNDPENEPSKEDVSNLLSAMLRSTQSHLKRSVQAGLINVQNKDNIMIDSYRYFLTEEQVKTFFERYEELGKTLKEWSAQNKAGDEGVDHYLMTNAFFQLESRDEE